MSGLECKTMFSSDFCGFTIRESVKEERRNIFQVSFLDRVELDMNDSSFSEMWVGVDLKKISCHVIRVFTRKIA